MPLRRTPSAVAALSAVVLCLAADCPAAADFASVVRVTGNMGEFDIQLLEAQTPKTAANFLGYVQRGDFSNSIIHRSVPGFIVQGGGFTLRSNTIADVPTRQPVTNEPFYSNVRGTVAMAKAGGDPHSATSQWFINLSDNNAANLDKQNGGFTVFGVVLGNGMAVADAVAALPFYDASPWFGTSFSNLPLSKPFLGAENFVAFQTVRQLAAGTQVFPFDFTVRDEKFSAGFADLPANFDPTLYSLLSSRTNLPANLAGTNGTKALFISGANRSDDLWMFWKRKAVGLLPNTVYEATFDLELASAAAAGMIGIGGAPGESVFLKAGASTVEPRVVIDKAGWLRMNIDKGNQSQPGAAASLLGHSAKPDDGNNNFAIIRRDNRSSRLRATTASDGSLWLFFGSDSGFEGTTSLYYTKFTAVLEPIGKVQNITFKAPGNQVFAPGKTFALSASNSSGRPVTFISGNTNVLAVISNTATIHGAGRVTITATNSGDAAFAPGGASRNVTIAKANQTIAWTNFPATNKFRRNGKIPLKATSSSGLAVTYTSATPGILTISGTNAVMKAKGTATITAAQAGNANFSAASNVVRTIVIK
jgi:peptidyl-prolyl cis-trans isomerase A (cyclophilin A)